MIQDRAIFTVADQ